ncbi:MAG: hypothetical protein ACI4SC_00840 [Candidatus Neoclostridium sp.]
MADEFKKPGLMDGLGKGEDDDKIVRWITVNGKHVPIKKGQTPKQAIEQAFDKPKNFINIQLFAHNSKRMGVFQLKKGIKTLERRISEHEEKIKNSTDSALINHWKTEIEAFKTEMQKYENALNDIDRNK